MSEISVVLNPTAGRGAGARLSSQIAARLQGYSLDFEFATTSAPGHALALGRDAVTQGKEAVIAVGGDGTCNEVLNGLMQAGAGPDGPALGILPIGTGNDFAFGAGLSLDLEEACQVVARGGSRTLDVGWMQADDEEPVYFGNGVGMGFDAIANIESRKLTRLRGFPLYLVAVLRTLAFYYDAPRIEIQIDEERFQQPSLMISVMNGHRMGGGFHMTPGSQMDDGLFDLCVAGKVSRPGMIALVPQFMRGTHTSHSQITMSQGRRVTVVSDSPWAAQADGEIYGVGARHFEIKLLPQRLRLLC
ncbi:diacylglycerol/lipid kinase family protein [Chloroflexota bacterium]